MQLHPTVEESGVIGDFLVDIFPTFADEDEVPDDERVQEGVLCSESFIIICATPYYATRYIPDINVYTLLCTARNGGATWGW